MTIYVDSLHVPDAADALPADPWASDVCLCGHWPHGRSSCPVRACGCRDTRWLS